MYAYILHAVRVAVHHAVPGKSLEARIDRLHKRKSAIAIPYPPCAIGQVRGMSIRVNQYVRPLALPQRHVATAAAGAA